MVDAFYTLKILHYCSTFTSTIDCDENVFQPYSSDPASLSYDIYSDPVTLSWNDSILTDISGTCTSIDPVCGAYTWDVRS